MSPLLLTGVRFGIAGAILLIVALAIGDRFPRSRRTLIELIVAGGLLICIGNFAVVWAEQWVPSGLAALFVATAPFWNALIQRLHVDGERIDGRSIAGMILGFAGVAMLVTPRGAGAAFDEHFVIGAIGIQVGALAWQYGTVRAKYKLKDVPPLMSSALQMLSGGIAITIIGLAMGESKRFIMTTDSVIALAYLTLFGSVLAYTAYVYALHNMRMTTMSLHAYINPLVAVILGWLFLREELTWVSIAAMCVILAGVAMVQMRRMPKQEPECAPVS